MAPPAISVYATSWYGSRAVAWVRTSRSGALSSSDCRVTVTTVRGHSWSAGTTSWSRSVPSGTAKSSAASRCFTDVRAGALRQGRTGHDAAEQALVARGVACRQRVGDRGERGVELGVGDDGHGLVGRVGRGLRQRVGPQPASRAGAVSASAPARSRAPRGRVDGWSARSGSRPHLLVAVVGSGSSTAVGSAGSSGSVTGRRAVAAASRFVRRPWRAGRRSSTRARPTAASRSRIPRAISGVLHGVVTSTGQVRVSCWGPGCRRPRRRAGTGRAGPPR